jgi:hypothetical protein
MHSKEKVMLLLFIAVFIATSSFAVTRSVHAATLNVPSAYPTIASAIAAANPAGGDTIVVAAGVYNEQILINKPVTIIGAGAATTTITSVGLVGGTPVVTIDTTGSVSFSGFTITGAPPDANNESYGMWAEQPVPTTGVTYNIYDCKFVGSDTPSAWLSEFQFYESGGAEAVVFNNNVVTQYCGNAFVSELHTGATTIEYSSFDGPLCLAGNEADVIFFMTYGGTNVNTLQKICYNTFNMGTTNPAAGGETAISISAPGFGSGNGQYTNVNITGNTIQNLLANKRGIGFWTDTGNNIQNAQVIKNLITGTGAAYSYGIDFYDNNGGTTIGTYIYQNTIENVADGIYLRPTAVGPSDAPGTIIDSNNIIGNNVGMNWTGINPTSQCTASNDWWNLNGVNIIDPSGVVVSTPAGAPNACAPPYTLTVSNDLGAGIPTAGTYTYNPGTNVTCSVTSPWVVGTTMYTCTGWTGTGDVPSSGTVTTTTFTMTQDSSITWNWISVSITPSSATLDVGQSQTFTSTVTGGTSPYSYQWYLDGSAVSGATSSSWTYTPTSSSIGSHTVYVKVSDSASTPATAQSNTASVTVSPALTVSISPSSVTLDAGQSATFSSIVAGGTSPYYYQWYLNGSAVSGATSPSWTYSPSSSGPHAVYLKVTDGASNILQSNTAPVTVNSAPSVSISPSSATIDVGQSQTFTSTVTGGTSPYSYQWYLDGSQVSTSSSYTCSPSSSGSHSVYVKVTDTASTPVTVQSNGASITVNSALSVSISPSSTTLDYGQSQTFTSSVSGGTSSYSYQWYYDSGPVSGATSNSWTCTTPSVATHHVYVVVTDHVGAQATSNTATLTVNSALSVSVSPSSVTMDVGQSKTLTTTVSGGTSSYTFQWYLNSSAVSGATSSSWTYKPSSSGSNTVYCMVKDSATSQATAQSNSVTVTVNAQTSVTISPTSASILSGQSQQFLSTVSGGTSPYTYQWYRNGTSVNGAASSSWTFTPSSVGHYSIFLKVTDTESQTAYSNNATLTVTPGASFNVTISQSATIIDLGQTVSVSSTVSGGTSPYTYQWYQNGTAISGATSSTLNWTPTSSGHYQIWLNVTATGGAVAKSNTCYVTANSDPTVSVTPTSVTMDAGQTKTFSSTVYNGSSPYTYQWYLDGSAMSGATSSSWTYTPSSAGAHTVYVKITDSVDVTATSNSASVTVNTALSATISPSSTTLDYGQSQTFTSSVSGGTASYAYQWYKNGTAVAGATGSTWTFTPSSAGYYTVYVKVTDSASTPVTAQSSNAYVTANPQLAVTVTPSTSTISLAQSQTFTSSVTGGTSPYTYQWYLNGTLVSGATRSTWNFTPSSTGTYKISVKSTDNVAQTVQSSNATLTVTSSSSLTVTISPTTATIVTGQSISFTSTALAGTSPYSYQWYLNGAPVSGATGASWTFTPTSSGSYTVYVKVTDSIGKQATSNTARVQATSSTASVRIMFLGPYYTQYGIECWIVRFPGKLPIRIAFNF